MKDVQQSASHNLLKYICFNLSDEKYAIPLLAVKEVIRVPDITKVPQTSAYFLGIMNLRGQIISVLDLRKKLGLKEIINTESTIMILNFDQNLLGVLVDCVNFVVSICENEISEKPIVSSIHNTDYLKGVFHKDNDLILILDILKTLSMDELKQLNKSAA